MPLSRMISGQLKPITRLSVRMGGVLRQLRTLKVMDGDTLKLVANFAPPLSVSVSPNFVSGNAFPLKPIPQTITTGFAQAKPTGGLAPYTYSWSSTDADYPNSASTSFTRTLAGNTSEEHTYTVTVNDSAGSTATASVTAFYANESF